MDTYDMVLAGEDLGLSESQKRKLRERAIALSEQNAETRRTASVSARQGIVKGTRKLSNQGLAGSFYGPYQSGAQERIVRAQNGVLDMTMDSLAFEERDELTGFGRNLVRVSAEEEELARRRKAQLEAQRYIPTTAVGTFKPGGQSVYAGIGEVMEADVIKKPTPTVQQTAYKAVTGAVGADGKLGAFRARTQTPQQKAAVQQRVYGAVANAAGRTKADTLFGMNPIAQEQSRRRAQLAYEKSQRDQAPLEPIDAETADREIKTIDERITELTAQKMVTRAQMQYLSPAAQLSASQLADANTAEIARLQAERQLLFRRKSNTIYTAWMETAKQPDFAKMSGADTASEDSFYRGVNGLASKYAGYDPVMQRQMNAEGLMPNDNTGYAGGRTAAENMTDEEIAVYNYLYATKGAQEAARFVKEIGPVRNARGMAEEQAMLEKEAKRAPVLSSIVSLAGAGLKPLGLMYSLIQGITGEDIDPNSPYFFGSVFTSTIRGTVSQMIVDNVTKLQRLSPYALRDMGYTDEEIAEIQSGSRAESARVLGNTLAFLYQTGMSIGDFLLASQTGSAASLTLMGTGMAADTIRDARLRGATNGQALALGIATGIAEVFFEKFSLDHFYTIASGTKLAFLKNTLAQMGIEASEEFFTEVADILADMVIMANNSNAILQLNAYMKQGMTREEAQRRLAVDLLSQTMLAALGGALSGGVIGAGASTYAGINAARGARVLRTVTNGVLDLTNPDTIEELRSYPKEQARVLEAQRDAVKRITEFDLSALRAKENNAVKAALIDGVVLRMRANGETEADIAKMKPILDAMLSGKKVLRGDYLFATQNPSVQEVFGIEGRVVKIKMNETRLKSETTSDTVSAEGGVGNGTRNLAGYGSGNQGDTGREGSDAQIVDGTLTETRRDSAQVAGTGGGTPGGRETRGRPGLEGKGSLGKVTSPIADAERAKSFTTEEQRARSVNKFAEDYNNLLERSGTTKIPRIEAGDVVSIGETSERATKYLELLKFLTGLDTYLYTTKSGRTDIPNGFASGGKSYILNTPENVVNMVFQAAHENAHNMPKIIAAGRAVVKGLSKETLDGYISARKNDVETKTRSQYEEELVADMFGAYMVATVTGDMENYKQILEYRHISEEDAETFANAFLAALEAPSIEEMDLESAASENLRRTFGGREYSETTPTEPAEEINIPDDIDQRLIDAFGTTSDFDKAGFILKSGKLLDLSGGEQERTHDHREIAAVIDLPRGYSPTKALVAFMNEGNIRIMPETNGIDLQAKPSKGQIETLRRFISHADGEITVDLDDEKGYPKGSYEYPKGTKAEKILADIALFFDTGEVRTVSDAERFHSINYSESIIAATDDAYLDEAMRLYKNGVTWQSYRAMQGYDKAVEKALRALWDTKRNVRILRAALSLYSEGTTPEQYWMSKMHEFTDEDHQIQLQLIGMYLRNNVPMGGRLGEGDGGTLPTLLKDIGLAPQYSQVRLSATSPARIFENIAAFRKETTVEARILNYQDGNRMRDTYFGYLMAQNASRNAYMQAWGQRVEAAFKKGTIRESTLAQLLGEGIVTEADVKDAIFDGDHMLVHAVDGWFVFKRNGNLLAFCDGDTTFVQDPKYTFKGIPLDEVVETKETTSQKVKKIAGKKPFRRVDGAVIHVARNGMNATISIPGILQPVEIKSGRSPDAGIAIDTATLLQQFYAEAWEMQSRVLVQNGYRPAGYIEKYFPHQWAEQTGVAAAIKQFVSYDLPTAIAGQTSVFKPGKPWAAHLMERKGPLTEYDAVRGFNKYVKSASDVIFTTPAVQRLRQMEHFMRTTIAPEDTTNASFVGWLKEYTNGIANKKAAVDRGIEDLFGREAYSISDALTMLISRSAVQGSVSSAMSNLISYISALPTLSPKYAAVATKDALVQTTFAIFGSDRYDGFTEKIPFLKMRFDTYEQILPSRWKRSLRSIDRIAGIAFAATDRFSVEAVARAKYAELLAKGETEESAAQKTSAYCVELFADRSKGMAPVIFNSKFIKPFVQFQLEVTNQLSHFRDIRRTGTGELFDLIKNAPGDDLPAKLATIDKRIVAGAAAKEWIRKLMYLFLLSLWGALTRELMGRDQTWNPYGMVSDFVKDTKESGVGQAALNAGASVLEQLPFTSGLTGGRIPLMSGVEKFSTLAEELAKGITGKGWNWDTIGQDALWAALSFVPLGGQIRKTVQGIETLNEKGSYKTNAAGEEQLQFGTTGEPGEAAKAVVFGKWALPQAQSYLELPRLYTPYETQGYKAALDAGIKAQDFFQVRIRFRGIEPTKDAEGNTTETANAKKRRELMKWPGLTPEQKKLLDKYLIAGEGSRPADYTSDALFELSLQPGATYQNALGMRNIGIEPETYLDYYEMKKTYELEEYNRERGAAQLKYWTEMTGDTVLPQAEQDTVNERLHQVIWSDKSLSERQRYQLEATLTGSKTWTDKAAKAASEGIKADVFYKHATFYREYDGEERTADLWKDLRADSGLTDAQRLELSDMLAGTSYRAEADTIVAAGINEKYASKYVAKYRDFKSSDTENPLGYSDKLTIKLAIAGEAALTTEQRMTLTDNLLGTTIGADAKAASETSGISMQTYYAFYAKYWTFTAKDENGETVRGLKKKRTIELLNSLDLTSEQRDYLLKEVGYRK